MTELVHRAGSAMAKAMLATLLVVAIGVSAAPNLDGAVALGIAGLASIIAAGLTAAQQYIPLISVQSYVAGLPGKLADAFLRAGVGAFVISILGWLAMPDLSTWHATLVAAIVGAVNVGLRAIQAALDPTEAPLHGFGVPPPK